MAVTPLPTLKLAEFTLDGTWVGRTVLLLDNPEGHRGTSKYYFSAQGQAILHRKAPQSGPDVEGHGGQDRVISDKPHENETRTSQALGPGLKFTGRALA